MNKNMLKELIEEGLSQREIAVRIGCSHSKTRRLLKRFELVTLPSVVKRHEKCIICKREHKDTRRRRCCSCSTKIRRIRAKWAAIQMLGGKCSNCGWIGSKQEMAAYEFHHVDGEKEFTISNVSNKSWDVIVGELKKCRLLCSRCHRIEHSDRSDPLLLSEAFENYDGTLLKF